MSFVYTGIVPFQVGTVRVYVTANPNGPGHAIKVEQNHGQGVFESRVNMVVMDSIISPGLVLFNYAKGRMSIYTIGNVRYDLMNQDEILQAWLRDHTLAYSDLKPSFENSPEYTAMLVKAEQDRQLVAPDKVTKESIALVKLDSDPLSSIEVPSLPVVPNNSSTIDKTPDKKISPVVMAVAGGVLLLLLL